MSETGGGPRPGLRLRDLRERPEAAAGARTGQGRRADALRRAARAVWAAVRPTRNRTTGYVAVGAVGALVGTSVAVGVGAAGALPRLADVGAWLGSSHKGEAAHANGLTGQVDGKVTLPGMAGDPVQISQDGKTVLVLDTRTGKVVRLDPSQLTAEQSTEYGAAGLQLVSGGAVSYLVDPAHGTVQRIDPVLTTPLGPKLDLGAPLGAAEVDPRGTLWVPVPSRGQVVPVTGDTRSPAVTVGRPGDNLVLTLAGGQPVVTDTTAGVLRTLSATGTQESFNLPGVAASGASGVLIPDQTDDAVVPVLDTGDGTMVLVQTGTGGQTDVKVPTGGDRLGAPQVLGSKVYIPDDSTGRLVVYDTATASFDPTYTVTGTPGTLNVFVRDGLLWANDENNATAAVINADGQAHRIGKYADDVPTHRQPREHDPVVDTVPTAPVHTSVPAGPTRHRAPSGPPPGPVDTVRPTPTPTPRPKPSPSRDCGTDWQPGCPEPMAPGTPQAQSGAGTITVTFAAASGTTPKDYTLSGAPAGATVTPDSVGPGGPFMFEVRGGSCGSRYTFTVVAHYAGGAPDKASQPSAPAQPCVVPTPPTVSVSVPQGGHGADLSWTSSGSGMTYTVSGAGATATTSGLSHSVRGLTNGRTYAVTVTARNGAGSRAGSATINLTPPARTFHVTDNSNNGDPLYVHTSPYATTANRTTTHINAGDNTTQLTVYCQTTGSHVSNDNGNYSGSIWDRIQWDGSSNSYVSDLWVSTANHRSGQFSPQDVWQCT
ncbi:hypothetical protein [Streptomyces sp. ICBB 8177]|uniref:hypothetical protein n=1 Tax=Streptomyces sp. ICBB 8177 TaxID=563922 RepID=UPI000D6748BB|nr:hypothetical protein [Streptomyces sp. ICBB 8177]PWI45532.1 hypothetical protein CK485_05335 [Streptomyces sp. ICBB 8177]